MPSEQTEGWKESSQYQTAYQFQYEQAYLELTNLCNFTCPFCPIELLSRPRGHMPVALAKRLICEIQEANLTKRLSFHVMGEPLLHPQCVSIFRFAKEKGFFNRLVTNGSMLGSDRAIKSLPFLDRVDISLRCDNDDAFRSVCKNIAYEDYINGAKSFLDMASNSQQSQVTIRMFANEQTETVLASLGIKAECKSDLELKVMHRVDRNIYYLLDPVLDWRNEKSGYPSYFFGNCCEFEKVFTVLTDGSISTCCFDYDGVNSVGRIDNNNGLVSILSNAKSDYFRGRFQKKRIPTRFCATCLARATLPRSIAYQLLAKMGRR